MTEREPYLPAWDQSDGVWCEKCQEDACLCPCLFVDEEVKPEEGEL